jgi:hypothetical protein
MGKQLGIYIFIQPPDLQTKNIWSGEHGERKQMSKNVSKRPQHFTKWTEKK